MNEANVRVVLWEASTLNKAMRLANWLNESGLASAEVRRHQDDQPDYVVEAVVDDASWPSLADIWPRENGLKIIDLGGETHPDTHFEEVFTTTRLAEASAVAMHLRTERIPARVNNAILSGGLGVEAAGWAMRLRVTVPQEQADQARAIIRGIQALPEGPPSALVDLTARPDLQTRRDGPELVAWPTCPKCHKSRVAICPYCGTTGTEFARAETPPDIHDVVASGERIDPSDEDGVPPVLFVLCPLCDEAFIPRFHPLCEWCEGGVPGEPDPSEEYDEELELLTRETRERSLVAGCTLVVALVALMMYFAWLAGR